MSIRSVFGRVFVAAASVCCATACGAASGEADERATSVGEALSSPDAFTFYLAARAHGHLSIARLDGAAMRCADGRSAAQCAIESIDYSALGIADADATALTARMGTDPRSSPLVLVGALTFGHEDARALALTAYEAWLAPSSSRPLAGEAFHLSHGGRQLVALKGFEHTTLRALDLSAAPNDTTCEEILGTESCAGAQTFGVAAAATQTGLLIVGTLGTSSGFARLGESGKEGVLRGTQFFRKVDIGQKHELDGAWVCSSSQITCGGTLCGATADACVHRHGDGRGLYKPIHATAPLFVGWLRTTGLIGPSESLEKPSAGY